jgi:predicted TPR repeat methyltransferase
MFARFLRQLLPGGRASGTESPELAPPNAPDPTRAILLGQQAENDGRLNEAVAYYEAARAGLPDSAELNTKLGNLLRVLGRNREAIAAYRDAVRLNPDFAAVHNNLGVALCAEEETDQAAACFRRAIAIEPGLAQAHENLGGVYYGRGRLADSLACFRQVLLTQPDNGNALHMVATMTGGQPERAADQYVVQVFDGYAERFEAHLVGQLEYDVPQQIAALVRNHAGTGRPATNWDVLDLGCGTGLVGAAIATSGITAGAGDLVGVDLSRKMLEKARVKNVYTRLEQADVQGMMQGEPAASYDLIVAADVFIYVGRLDGIVTEVKRLLRPGGLFGFSVEALEGARQGYLLMSTGRYTHAVRYLEELASDGGFRVLAALSTPIRKQDGVPVPGWLFLWQSPFPPAGGAD